MVIVFDLDDTLYNELDYVKSGFQAVAKYLYEKKSLPLDSSFAFMMARLVDGRGHIFDDLLQKEKIASKKLIKDCINIYRNHRPDISLDAEAVDCLKRLNHYLLYIVTDGNKLVQKNKLEALGLFKMVKFCFITHRYGLKNAKPSPYCFLKICDRERVNPTEVVYIGDNPNKDFVGIKPLGFKTIRIIKGHYKDIQKPDIYEASYRINSLAELNNEFLKKIFDKK